MPGSRRHVVRYDLVEPVIPARQSSLLIENDFAAASLESPGPQYVDHLLPIERRGSLYRLSPSLHRNICTDRIWVSRLNSTKK